jgi:hypothetical protein
MYVRINILSPVIPAKCLQDAMLSRKLDYPEHYDYRKLSFILPLQCRQMDVRYYMIRDVAVGTNVSVWVVCGVLLCYTSQSIVLCMRS